MIGIVMNGTLNSTSTSTAMLQRQGKSINDPG